MVRFLFFAWEAKPQAMLSSYLNSLFSATIFFEIIQNKIYFSAVNINQCNKFIPSVTVDFSVFAEWIINANSCQPQKFIDGTMTVSVIYFFQIVRIKRKNDKIFTQFFAQFICICFKSVSGPVSASEMEFLIIFFICLSAQLLESRYGLRNGFIPRRFAISMATSMSEPA